MQDWWCHGYVAYQGAHSRRPLIVASIDSNKSWLLSNRLTVEITHSSKMRVGTHYFCFPDYTLRICPGRLFIQVCIDFCSGSRNLPTTIHPSHLASSPPFPIPPPLCTPSQLAYTSFSILARSVFVRCLACAVICISALMRTSSLLVPHSARPDIMT